MEDELGEGLIATLDHLAKTYVIASVFYTIFLVANWPFMTIARLIVFILSFGTVKPNYKESFNNSFVVMLATVIFLFTFGYLHIIYGAKLYGNLS